MASGASREEDPVRPVPLRLGLLQSTGVTAARQTHDPLPGISRRERSTFGPRLHSLTKHLPRVATTPKTPFVVRNLVSPSTPTYMRFPARIGWRLTRWTSCSGRRDSHGTIATSAVCFTPRETLSTIAARNQSFLAVRRRRFEDFGDRRRFRFRLVFSDEFHTYRHLVVILLARAETTPDRSQFRCTDWGAHLRVSLARPSAAAVETQSVWEMTY